MLDLCVNERSDLADGKLERTVDVEVERGEIRRGFLSGRNEARCLVHGGGGLCGRKDGLISMWLRLQPRRIHEIPVDLPRFSEADSVTPLR